MAISFAPRQEANPLEWTSLSPDQQALVTQVHEWLTALLRSRYAEKRDKSFVPDLDVARASHVLLIDGRRGVGKTTVMLSLLRMWTEALHEDAAPPEPEQGAVNGLLKTKRVIPIQIMDMQPLAGHPSLLLQLAGRMYRVTEQLMSKSAAKYEEGNCCQSPASVEAWRQLVQAVAMGAEDDPRQRRSSSNPEDFAIEQEQAERKRMTIGEQWRKFVDTLLADVGAPKYKDLLKPYVPGADPVFIVPIDDADMNPERGVELLELLRSLWHPRVIFLLTGNVELFRTLLFNHYKKGCKRMPKSMARNLAHDVLGKLIPPAQRLRCRVEPGRAFDYLKGQGVLPSAITDRVTRAQLHEAFPRRWRILRDLEQSLIGKQSTPVEFAKVLFEEAVRASALSPTEQEHLMSSCFKPARRGPGLRVDESAVSMQPETDVHGQLSLDSWRAVSWNVSDGDRWSLAARSAGTVSSEVEVLPDSIVLPLYLAASIASEPQPADETPGDTKSKYTRVERSLSLPNYDLIKSTFSFTPIQYKFPWPTPEWVDPIDFYLFLQGWRDALSSQRAALSSFPGATQGSSSQMGAFESLVSWWISAICSLANHKDIQENSWQQPGDLRWQCLGHSIAELANSPRDGSTPRQWSYVEWARQSALFFSHKVCGLKLAARNHLLTGWLTKLCPLIAEEKNGEVYWILVNDATHGQIEFLRRASQSIPDTSIEQQIDCAIRTVSNPTWRMFTPNGDQSSGEVSIKKFKRAFTDSHGEVGSIEELRFAIQALDPESESLLDQVDMNARLLQYIRGNDARSQARRIQHFRAQLEIRLSQIKLASVPYPLSVLAAETGSNLWTRAKNIGLDFSWDVTGKLAESNNILEHLSKPMPATNAWKIMIESFLASKASLNGRTATQIIDDFLERTQNAPMTFLSTSTGTARELTPTHRIQYPKVRFEVSELAPWVPPDQNDVETATELLVKLHDIVADETDAQYQSIDEPVWPDHLSVTGAGANYRVALPGWPSSVDFLLHWASLVGGISWLKPENMPVADAQHWDPWTVLCGYLLDSCLAIRASRVPGYMFSYINVIKMKIDGRDADFLQELCRSLSNTVVQANDSRYTGRRARAIREWVNMAGPLFAAPETGMSPELAASWLAAWDRSPSNTADPAVCKRLSDFRLKRAQLSIGPDITPEKAREFLDGIDANQKGHPWVRFVEARAKGAQSA